VDITRREVNIGNNFLTTQAFLTNVYRKTSPLFNPVFETQAPEPTHLEVIHAGQSVTIALQAYNSDITFTHAVQDLTNVQIVFLRLTGSGFLKLSVSAMTVR
jgi:hypothetical protein